MNYEITQKMRDDTRTAVTVLSVACAFAAMLLVLFGASASFARADATTSPVISSVAASSTDTTADVTWMTNQPASSQVMFGTTTSYGSSSVLDTGLVNSHSVILTALHTNTLYHYQVMSSNASSSSATSSDETFITKMTATTSTSTPDHDQVLRDLIEQILQKLLKIEAQIVALIAQQHGGGSNGSSTTTLPVITGVAFVDQNGASARAGTSIDFGGHNFGSEEHVTVMLGGSVIATGFTNLGGGFSTGSLSVPTIPGTYLYTFRGVNSGRTAQAMVTITP